MTVDFEYVLNSVWPDWHIVEPISISEATTVYKAKRQDMMGTSEAAIKVTMVPADLNEIDSLKLSGLSDDAIRLQLEQRVRETVRCIQVMDSIKGYTNILRADDYKVIRNEETGQWFVIVRMELLTPLLKRLQIAPFTEEDIVRLGLDLSSALDICGRYGIVHRNIKPENIFLSKGGDYKLGDFGLARNLKSVAQSRSAVELPNYLAPEVYNELKESMDFEASSRTDIYSLGMVMYYLANNKRMPFLSPDKQIISPADRRNAFARRVAGEPLPGLPRVSHQLEAIIRKACAYRMEDRYATAAEMRNDLLMLSQQEPVGQPQELPGEEACPVRPELPQEDSDMPVHISLSEIIAPPVRKEPRRRKPVLILLCMLLAVVLGVGGWAVAHCLHEEDVPAVVEETVDSSGVTRTISVPGFMNDPVRVSIALDDRGMISSVTADVSSQLSRRSKGCAEAAFLDQFIGREGPFAAGENIDVCSGATHTSKAIIDAVNQLQSGPAFSGE